MSLGSFWALSYWGRSWWNYCPPVKFCGIYSDQLLASAEPSPLPTLQLIDKPNRYWLLPDCGQFLCRRFIRVCFWDNTQGRTGRGGEKMGPSRRRVELQCGPSGSLPGPVGSSEDGTTLLRTQVLGLDVPTLVGYGTSGYLEKDSERWLSSAEVICKGGRRRRAAGRQILYSSRDLGCVTVSTNQSINQPTNQPTDHT